MADVATLIRSVEELSKELQASTTRVKQLQAEYIPLVKENESLHRELKRFSGQGNVSGSHGTVDVQRDSYDSDKLQQLWRQSLSEVERLTEELSKERRKYRPMDTQLKEMNDRHDKAVQQHMSTISRLETDLQSLKHLNLDLSTRAKKDKLKIESLTEEITIKTDAIARLEQQEFRLNSELAKLRSVATRNESLTNENRQLLQVHSEYEDLKRKLEAQERIFFARLSEVTNILDSCFSDRDQAVITLQAEQEKRSSLQGEFEKLLIAETDKWNQKLKGVEAVKSMETQSLRNEVAEMNKEIFHCQSDAHLKEQDLREKCRDLEMALVASSQEKQRVEGDLKSANLKVDRLQRERDVLQITLDEVQVELKAKLHRR